MVTGAFIDGRSAALFATMLDRPLKHRIGPASGIPPGWRARRWVVEACHSWLNRNRGILIRWSKKDENHLALLQLASSLIAFKKARAATHAAAPPG
jgi:hypothetical protein